MNDFADQAIRYTLVNEGGYSNDPEDHGGPTNWGITQADYSEYLGRHATAEDVRHMSEAQAIAIYKSKYWNPLYNQLADQGMATAIFDWGVVHGVKSAVSLAQVIGNELGAHIVEDGKFGPITASALGRLDAKAFIRAYAAAVKAHFEAIVAHNPSQHVFLKGWLRRADRLLTLV